MSAFDLIKMKAEQEKFDGGFINADVEVLSENLERFTRVEWKPVRISSDDTLVQVLKYIEEGSTYGFHYKIENGVLWCTQDDIEHEFVHNLLTIKIADKP